MPGRPLRILEIGHLPYFQRILPEATSYVATGARSDTDDPDAILRLRDIPKIWRMAHGTKIDLIVCRPPYFAPLDPRLWGRMLTNRRVLRGDLPLVRAFGSQLLRGRLGAPLAVLDMEDVPYVDRHNFHLLDAASIYFKRELPIDHWRIFQRTGHHDLPTPRFRRDPLQLRRLAKLRPISVGLPFGAAADLPAAALPKSSDVFFAGLIDGSSVVRKGGLEELQALRAEGLVIDVPGQRLPRAEFYARMARARLVWSPEGLGSDCFRHYEAGACFSVPLISRATIHRYCPLIEGEHAFYYDVEPGGLTRAVRAALADPVRLDAVTRQGRAHVLAHHTPQAVVEHVIATVLGARRMRSIASEIGAGTGIGGE